jgi:hypothetical protein
VTHAKTWIWAQSPFLSFFFLAQFHYSSALLFCSCFIFSPTPTTFPADELEQQQGIAHLTEHVAYMGSRKRERLFGTGSQTNAYTDFHHTVFYAACPTSMPRSANVPMLPLALDALCDVMEAKVEPSRLEKERAAVLSEMTMVNTIEYRVECQILSTLHRENRLAKRFPIGKESLINTWTPDNVKTWHRTHYRPDNVLLYIVGDIDVPTAEKTIAEKFGHLSSAKQATEMNPGVKEEASKLADALNAVTVKAKQSWHYPPVIHDWCGTDHGHELAHVQENANEGDELAAKVETDYDIHLKHPMPLDEKVAFLHTSEIAEGKRIRPHIFRYVSTVVFAEVHGRPLPRCHPRPSSISCILYLAYFISSLFFFDVFHLLPFLLSADTSFCKHFRCTCLPSDPSNQLWICNLSDTVWQDVWHWLPSKFG